jgi:plastocyanin
MTSRTKALLATATFAIATVGVIVLAVTLSSSSLDTKSAQAQPSCPSGQRANHQATIQNNQVTPAHTTAPLCDTLTITNADDTVRIVAFGPHENHVPYDGVTEKVLGKGQSLAVTLIQAGDYRFHDHIHDEVQGTFTVTYSTSK